MLETCGRVQNARHFKNSFSTFKAFLLSCDVPTRKAFLSTFKFFSVSQRSSPVLSAYEGSLTFGSNSAFKLRFLLRFDLCFPFPVVAQINNTSIFVEEVYVLAEFDFVKGI
ncbi:hypothetical protein SESBI_33282 [Sesbania bispinosa]|nr:hypothetical protein SESBI_33282 [Sesbania bispinosa]